eukprot:COSAG02_NODE_63864_length_262_cov_0.631902_1_plen_48_part_01
MSESTIQFNETTEGLARQRAVNERGSLTEEAAVRERAGMSMSWDACV